MVKKIVLVFTFTLFLLKGFYMLDPDFGWHIKMGELILSSGIPATDPFSYTMPSFPFVDHEWGINILMYLLYKNFGWGVLSLIFSAIAVLAILISFKGSIKSYFLLPFILASGSLLFFAGIRPQLIAWLFFSILITIFLKKKYYEKFRFILPFFFLFWANLHGGFPIGLTVYFLFLIIKFYEKRKLDFIDLVLFASSVFITLVNPYGIRLWQEVFMQISDGSLRWNIMEWRPAVFSFYPAVLGLFAFSFSFLLIFRKKFTLFEKVLYFCLLLAGLSSIRHVPFWVIFTIPILLKGLIFLSEKAEKIKYAKERFNKAYKFSVILALVFVLLPLLSERRNPFLVNEEDFYPKKAVGFLKKNPASGEVFSSYGWGGYLIWKMPSKKVFIDGRMPSWRWKANIPNESNYAFKDYLSLDRAGVMFEPTAKKYKITTVLLPYQKDKKKKTEDIYTKLKKEGWMIVYKDDVSLIYRKK